MNGTILFCIIVGVMFVFAIAVKPIRKAMGLLFVILGFIACLTLIGIVVGIPMILVGGFLLFC
jgi:hypothetical protein